ncbi:hypothetical protein BOX15_Mlig020357g5, partial [Macrostomum lignano]
CPVRGRQQRPISESSNQAMSNVGSFGCEYAKRGTAGCKQCKQKIDKDTLRLCKVAANPFSSEGGEMKMWYHAGCLFSTFERARATTRVVESLDDLDGAESLQDADKKLLQRLIDDLAEKRRNKAAGGARASPKKLVQTTLPVSPAGKASAGASAAASSAAASAAASTLPTRAPLSMAGPGDSPEDAAKDNAFRTFRKLVAEIADRPGYSDKTRVLAEFLAKGSTGGGFKGDLSLLIRLLLPGVERRVYNVKDRQLLKIFSGILGAPIDAMQELLNSNGDIAETVGIEFDKRGSGAAKSSLSMQEVDAFLDRLAGLSREDDQGAAFKQLAAKCTGNDLRMVLRLVRHDLRMNAGSKHILDAIDPNAYAAFQASRNLHDVLQRALAAKASPVKRNLSVRAALMTPVLPMLAEACRSVEHAMRRCPNGFYAEIKYDGERVQVHKQGQQFSYFSRSLKPVQPHKVAHLKEFIPRAFPGGDNLIVDAEVLLMDTKTDKPLPFGTLGVHKKEAFKDATVCLFVFDCLQFNNDNLMLRPLKERREVLERSMQEVKHRVHLSEAELIRSPAPLERLLKRVFNEGLEGLVLKSLDGVYEPGKRHWLKMKKDYLHDGAMADSADLVVLGGYYGTGSKGGQLSIFLMGCHDGEGTWRTVCKCANGFDDATVAKLQKSIDWVKYDRRSPPSWLRCSSGLLPDCLVRDPKASPVWEITGAEFSHSSQHTTGGVGIRFPRVTKVRDDKTWREATNLQRLQKLAAESKRFTGDAGGDGGDDDDEDDGEAAAAPPPKKAPAGRKLAKSAEASSSSPPKRQRLQLPDALKSARICFAAEVLPAERRELERLVFAYDGDVVDEAADATHLVRPDGAAAGDSAPGVAVGSVSWLRRCLAARRLLPVT